MTELTESFIQAAAILMVVLSYGLTNVEAGRMPPPPQAQTLTDAADPIDSNATLLGR